MQTSHEGTKWAQATHTSSPQALPLQMNWATPCCHRPGPGGSLGFIYPDLNPPPHVPITWVTLLYPNSGPAPSARVRASQHRTSKAHRGGKTTPIFLSGN